MSLPTRERGLKDHLLCVFVPFVASLPTRERGLKDYIIGEEVLYESRSLRGSVD